MNLTILFFGATADIVGKREVQLDISDDLNVGEAMEQIKQDHPGLGSHRLLVALNEEYVTLDAQLQDGDTLAVFTAVSGG
jgi:molybdopterin synthase sulfur carrier subunit